MVTLLFGLAWGMLVFFFVLLVRMGAKPAPKPPELLQPWTRLLVMTRYSVPRPPDTSSRRTRLRGESTALALTRHERSWPVSVLNVKVVSKWAILPSQPNERSLCHQLHNFRALDLAS